MAAELPVDGLTLSICNERVVVVAFVWHSVSVG